MSVIWQAKLICGDPGGTAGDEIRCVAKVGVAGGLSGLVAGRFYAPPGWAPPSRSNAPPPDDWVVIFCERDGVERQCTVVTEITGPLTGRRVVRGREEDCRQHYEGERRAGSVPRRSEAIPL